MHDRVHGCVYLMLTYFLLTGAYRVRLRVPPQTVSSDAFLLNMAATLLRLWFSDLKGEVCSFGLAHAVRCCKTPIYLLRARVLAGSLCSLGSAVCDRRVQTRADLVH